MPSLVSRLSQAHRVLRAREERALPPPNITDAKRLDLSSLSLEYAALTVGTTNEALKGQIDAAVEKEESAKQLADRVDDLFGRTMSYRSILIARTQLTDTIVEGTLVAEKTESTRGETALHWAGPTDRILVYLLDSVGIYDRTRDNWITVDALPIPVNNTPIRPDGKGFLAFTGEGKNNRFVFVDWDGWVFEFKDYVGEANEKAAGIRFEWDKNLARITTSATIREFDTESMSYSVRNNPVAVMPGGGELAWSHRFRNSDSILWLLMRKDLSMPDSSAMIARLELQVSSTGKRKVILPDGDYSITNFSFFPSPDGKKIAVRCKTASDRDTIVVIDDVGTIIAALSPE